MAGKRYYNPETGVWKTVKDGDPDLYQNPMTTGKVLLTEQEYNGGDYEGTYLNKIRNVNNSRYFANKQAANHAYKDAEAQATKDRNNKRSMAEYAASSQKDPQAYLQKQYAQIDAEYESAMNTAKANYKSARDKNPKPTGYNEEGDKEEDNLLAEEEKAEEEKKKADAKAKADEAAKAKGTTTTTEKKVQPAGASLFSGLSAAAGKMIYGESGDPMGRDAHLNRQSEMHDREAAKHDVAAQKENQIANRDERRETAKDALADGATKSKDAVNKLGNVGAGAAALARVTGEGNLDANRNRKDQARQKGVENMEKAEDERQLAEQERSGADVYGYQARDMQVSNQESDELSKGKGDTVQEDNTKKEEDQTKVDPPDPEKDKPEKKKEPVEGNWQEAINLLSYGADESSQHFNNGANEADGQRLLDYYNAKPLTMQQVQDYVQKKRPNDAALLWGGGQWTDGQSKNEFLTFGKNDPRRAKQAGLLQEAIGYYYPELYEDWKASGQSNGRFDVNGNQINEGQKLSDGTTATGAGFAKNGKMTINPDTKRNVAAAIADTKPY